MLIRARYVVPLDRPVIENGAVAITGERIAAVGRYEDVRRAASAAAGLSATAIDLGDAVVLPGFVNAHTHLELSCLAGHASPSAFLRQAGQSATTKIPPLIAWLEELMAFSGRIGDDGRVIEASVQAGLRASLDAGVSLLGDITRLPNVTRPLLRDGPARVVSFGEVVAIGKRRSLLEQRLQAAIDATHASATLNVALSPHAPYTVEPAALRACAAAARQASLRICVHTAESAEEETFTVEGRGPFRDYLERLGVWDDDVECAGQRPIELLDDCGLLGPRTLLAHANYVNNDDIDQIAVLGAHVVYCPRTHAAFGHAPHPWRRMLARGVNVCVGTDSLASNPDLSVLEELRFLHAAAPEVAPHDLFRLSAPCGSAALGLADQVGTLSTGKFADLVALPCPLPAARDPLGSLLEARVTPTAVWIAGRRIR